MYDDEFELTFNLQDEDAAPVELPKAAEEAGPEAPAETREPAADEEPTIVLPDRRPEPAAEAAAPDMPQPEAPAAPEPQPEAPPRPANGRCVLISGGDRGIGAAAARAFYAAGDRVAVFYHTNADAAAALEQELPGCIAIQCDVASRASCEVAFHAAEQALGRVDVLVSNAGIAQQKLFTDITPDEWQHMLDVNLTGAFHLCQLALPGMIRRKAGRILTVSSMWGQTGGSCEVHYSAAKAGLIGLTKALAKEEGPSGSGCHRHRYDGCLYRRGQGGTGRGDPGGPSGQCGRGGEAAGVPRRRGCRVHHRPGVRRERRPGDLTGPTADKTMIQRHFRAEPRPA